MKKLMHLLLGLTVTVCAGQSQAQSWGPSLDGAKAEKIDPRPHQQPKPAVKRRAVRGEPITMPAAPQVRTTVAVPTTVVASPSVAVPPAPIPVTACDPGGHCRDAAGRLLQGGVGTTLLDAHGRQCVRQGAFVQCQ